MSSSTTGGTGDKLSLLEEADRYLFSTGLGDASSQLSRYNMRFGLSKLRYAQKELGMEQDALFVSAPDECTTRNVQRWKNGFGYGGKLIWGKGDEKVVFLDVLPNACGILTLSLPSLPDLNNIMSEIQRLSRADRYLDDIRVETDIDRGNHFIDIFRVERSARDISPYICFIHAGTPELKGDNNDRTGLYYNKSRMVRDMTLTLDTPLGPVHYVADDDAERYLRAFEFANNFSKKKRELIARELFEDHTPISNHCHQGLLSYNEVVLGANSATPRGTFPLALRAYERAYFLSALPNLSDKTMEELGFKERAAEIGAYDRIANANLLPHGGGYSFPMMGNVVSMDMVNGRGMFGVEPSEGHGIIYFSNIRQFPFSYRGQEVVDRVLELELGEIDTVLDPIWVLNL